MKTLLIGAALAAALATGASAQTGKLAQCFNTTEIRNSRVVDDSTINLKVRKDVYQIKMVAPCSRLRTSTNGYSLTLRGSNQICSTLDLDIGVNDLGGGKCLAQSIRKLSPAEAAALPKKEMP